VENLFDARYQGAFGHRTAANTALAGIELTFCPPVAIASLMRGLPNDGCGRRVGSQEKDGGRPLRTINLRGRQLRPAAVALAAAASLAAVAGAAAAEGGKPVRIVSLDVCADQILVGLVERGRIAAVTHLAADPEVSAAWEQARGLPVTRGAAEDVLGHKPDLILAGPFGVAPTVALLRRLNLNVVIVPMASDLEGIRSAVRTVAAAVGETARGEAAIAAFDRRLAGIAAAPPGPRPSAVVYQVGGEVLGAGSLADAALSAAGLSNKAAAYRLNRSGQVPLEPLAADPPDLLVLTGGAGTYRTVAADNLRHPVLGALRRRRAAIELPGRYWLCGTPYIAEAIARLAKARARIGAGRQ
jgi:iron complex transport system substrate-binding protein